MMTLSILGAVLFALLLALYWAAAAPRILVEANLRETETGKRVLRLWCQNAELFSIAGPIQLTVAVPLSDVDRIEAFDGPGTETRLVEHANEFELLINEMRVSKTLVYDVHLITQQGAVRGALQWPTSSFSHPFNRGAQALPEQRLAWEVEYGDKHGTSRGRRTPSLLGSEWLVFVLMMLIACVVYGMGLVHWELVPFWRSQTLEHWEIPVLMLATLFLLFVFTRPGVPPVAQSYHIAKLVHGNINAYSSSGPRATSPTT